MTDQSEYKTVEAVEQQVTFDGKYKPAIDSYLLMCIINNKGSNDADEIAEMTNPKRLAVRVIIETRELPI